MALIDEHRGVDLISVMGGSFKRKTQSSSWLHSHYMVSTIKAPEQSQVFFKGHLETEEDHGVPFVKGERIMVHQPNFWSIWKSSVAKEAGFYDTTYWEDTYFVIRGASLAKTEAQVNEVLFFYFADDSTSESGIWRTDSAHWDDVMAAAHGDETKEACA